METTARTALNRALALSLTLLVVTSAAQFFTVPVADNDLWGHLLFGREILAERSLPRTNQYSYTAPSYPWINHEILAECILAATYDVFGSTGLLVLRWMLGLATLAASAAICLRRGASILATAISLVFAASLMSFGYLSRPQLFTYLFLGVLWEAIDRFATEPRSRAIWWIPLVFALWVNTHGGVLAGVAVLGLAAAVLTIKDARARPLIGVTAASTAALLVNPYGFALPEFLLRDVTIERPITEWASIPLFDASNFQFKIACLLAVAGWGVRNARKRPWEMLVVGAAAVATFRHERHLPLFAVLATPHLSSTLDAILARLGIHRLSRGAEQTLACAVVLLVGVQLWMLVSLHQRFDFGIAVPRTAYPIDAVRFLRERGGGGNLAVPFGWGEYALWHLHPSWRVSIDGRYTTAYPEDVIDLAWRYMDGRPGWDRLLENATVALADTSHMTPRMLDRHVDWQLVYADATAKLYARRGTVAAEGALPSPPPPPPRSPSLFP